jgi:hypothetical protein
VALPVNSVPPTSPNRARTWIATALVVVAAIVASAANVALWARDTALDTDTYLDTVVPLVSDEELTEAVAERLTDLLFDNVGAEALAAQFLPDGVDGLAGLVGPADDLLRPFVVEQVEAVLRSGRVADLWELVNREAHELFVDALTGRSEYLRVDGDRVVLDLSPAVEALGDQLAEWGLGFADRELPDGVSEITVFESPEIGDAVDAIDRLDRLATVLPLLAVVLVVAGVAIAPRRARALGWGGVALAASSVVLLVGQVVVGDWALGSITEPIAELAGRSLWSIAGGRLAARTAVLAALGAAVALVGFGAEVMVRRRAT